LHLVDATGEHAGKAYKNVRRELEAYGAGLAEKPEIVALSKVDAVDPETLKAQRDRLRRAANHKPLLLSSASGAGVTEALRALASEIEEAKASEKQAEPAPAWAP
jgi:GTP-binding protein